MVVVVTTIHFLHPNKDGLTAPTTPSYATPSTLTLLEVIAKSQKGNGGVGRHEVFNSWRAKDEDTRLMAITTRKSKIRGEPNKTLQKQRNGGNVRPLYLQLAARKLRSH